MRMQELIRGMIDMIDHMQINHPITTPKVIVAHPTATITPPEDASPLTHAGEDINRWRQIIDLADNGNEPIGNSPDEKYADINSVTIHAGGGMMGPKHPADIRVNNPSIYSPIQDSESNANQPHIVMIRKLNGEV